MADDAMSIVAAAVSAVAGVVAAYAAVRANKANRDIAALNWPVLQHTQKMTRKGGKHMAALFRIEREQKERWEITRFVVRGRKMHISDYRRPVKSDDVGVPILEVKEWRRSLDIENPASAVHVLFHPETDSSIELTVTLRSTVSDMSIKRRVRLQVTDT